MKVPTLRSWTITGEGRVRVKVQETAAPGVLCLVLPSPDYDDEGDPCRELAEDYVLELRNTLTEWLDWLEAGR